MKPSFWQQADHVARNLVPSLLTLLLVLLFAAPMPLPNLGPIVPGVALLAVFHWSIYRPDLLPAPAVFAIGVLQDFLSGGVPGLSAVVLLGVRGVVGSQRRFFLGKSFLVIWWALLMVAVAAGAVTWLLTCLSEWRWVSPEPMVFRNLLTLVLYPVFARLFVGTQRTFLQAE